MIVPDFLQICEIMLFSEGFEYARVLAKKMTTLYKLASEQLSKQVSSACSSCHHCCFPPNLCSCHRIGCVTENLVVVRVVLVFPVPL